ncbi:hypothetical protein RYH73_02475 [Olivibacter sp. CPCC 100613]|uniref:hypothetical protein n=1 Tax=Olivibacter sp. CPCC 100613 TaxID=3079931 RepID=UPI002FF93B24
MKKIYVSLIVSSICFGCTKEKSIPEGPNVETQTTLARHLSPLGIVSPTLDWESIDLMPMPSGSYNVVVPWGSAASRQMPEEFVHDYKKVDGWELVYNTFTSSTIHDHLFFVLYNKYRGIIRMYYYVKPGNYIFSTNIVHTLMGQGTYSANSPILNFTEPGMIDISENKLQTSTLENFQVAPGTWYAFQYELAYDENLVNQNYQNFSFLWPIKSNKIQQVSVNGTIQGTLTNSLSVSNVNLTTTPNFSGNANIPIYSSYGASSTPGSSPSIVKTILDALGGVVKDLLGGLFGKKSGGAEVVQYAINANVNLTGQITSDFLVGSLGLAVPGYDQSQTTGLLPIYNERLGVFYLSDKPIINETTQIHSIYDQNGMEIDQRYVYHYQAVDNSYQMVFNPAVLAVANIENLTKRVITTDGGNLLSGTRETIGVTGVATQYEGSPTNVIGLRISFDVVPKNGSPRVKIVKSFKTNISYSTEYLN